MSIKVIINITITAGGVLTAGTAYMAYQRLSPKNEQPPMPQNIKEEVKVEVVKEEEEEKPKPEEVQPTEKEEDEETLLQSIIRFISEKIKP